MAFTHGKDAVFSLDDSGGSLRALSAFVDSVSGLPGTRNLSEVSAFGDEGTKNIPGLQNAQISISGHWDPTATTGPDAVLSSLLTATATATFEYGPGGGAAAAIKYTGECWLTDYTTDASVSDKVSFSASLQVDGVVTRTAYA